jgi:glyoxylase-like metal-dependent hydrolase (beta-lactamase superfamily II)
MSKPHRLFIFLSTFACAFAALPTAGAWSAPEKSYVKEIAPGVFFRKAQTKPVFTGCNQGWVVFKDYVLVIDANFPGQAKMVIAEIRKHTDKPIKYIFDTHHHGDHADGNAHYEKIGATVVASERSQPKFETTGADGFRAAKKSKPEEYGDVDYVMPSKYFEKRMVLDDGEQHVELLYFGHGHTVGDAVAWLPKHGILFTGDAIVNGAFNYMGESDSQSWIAVINTIEKMPIKIIAPGHGDMGDKEILVNQRRYFAELRAAVQKAIDAGKTLDDIKLTLDIPFYKKWAGVDVKTRVGNIEHVYGELTGK